MRRIALLTLALALAPTALVIFAPLSGALEPYKHQTTAAQVDTGSIFDEIDSLLTNFTKRFDLNSLVPQLTTTPSVKIVSVKAVNTGQSSAAPQVVVTVQNGKIALNDVKIDVVYKNSAGANVLSNTTVVALKPDETRSITFSPQGLSQGTYTIGVVVYESGTNPSNQATPPYDAQQNAATLTIANPTPSKQATGNAEDEGFQMSNAGAILSNFSPWVYFIIAMTGLVSVALFFVFSQNRSAEDRYEPEHFTGSGYERKDGSLANPRPLDHVSPKAVDRWDDTASGVTVRPRSRKIEVTGPKESSQPSGGVKARHPPTPTDQKLQFDSDGFVVGDVTSKKALRTKMRGKKGV